MKNENSINTNEELLKTKVLELEKFIHESKEIDPDIINLREIWNKLWSDKWLIVLVGSIFIATSIFHALSLANQYKSEILLAPVNEVAGGKGSLSKLAGRFSGLASLAGINLGDTGDKTALAMETMKSRKFLIQFIKNNNLLVPLVAGKRWDSGSNVLEIDKELYDERNNLWVRDVSWPKQKIPSYLEAREFFLERLGIKKDDESGYITISIEFYSPYIAKQWLELLILAINDTIRIQDIKDASNTIAYLENQISETNISEMKSVFYELIENQTQTLMLANVREEYVFKTIDPAFVTEKRSKPKRAFIVLFGALIGGILGVAISLIRKRK